MRTATRFMILAVLLTALPAAAQMHWNQVGSTGILDETSVPHQFTQMTLEHAATATGTIVARYPVTNVWGSSNSFMPPWSTLEMAHIDNSPSAVVSARLVEVDRCTNIETTVCSVSSVDGPTATTCRRCSWVPPLDFGNNVYYVEVRVSRSVTNVTASLQHLNIQ